MTATKTTRKAKTPKLRFHKASGQAYAVIGGKAVYFGRYDDPQATQKYHQVIAEWLAAGKQISEPQSEITIRRNFLIP